MGQSASHLPGSAHLELVEGVVHLEPERAVFKAMLQGWARQQQARFLKEETIERRVALVHRMAIFTGQYPWQWLPGEGEAFITQGCSGERGRPIAMSTARGYETDLRLFMEYLTDPRDGWPLVCHERFGTAPQQLFHERNSIVHVSDYEGQPGRRPLSYAEVQALFDAADGRVEEIRARRRKGALAAMRDAAVLKTIYAFGLRRREAWGLDMVDLRHNPKVGQYGRFGALFVRHGKASRGSPPKRRTVLTVPEMDWVVEQLEHWYDELRPLFSAGGHPALFVTERRGRISTRHLNDALAETRSLAGLPAVLDLHALRHSYVTHLLEFGYPQLFVQQQVGHAHAATTALYTSVSDEFRNRLLERSLARF